MSETQILLLIYAWNSCPVPGINILRSMVAVGREFSFPIDFSIGKNDKLFSARGTIMSYSKELDSRLDSCHEIVMLLIKEQQSWHCKLINSCRHDHRIYNEGDIVFTRYATQSNSKRQTRTRQEAYAPLHQPLADCQVVGWRIL